MRSADDEACSRRIAWSHGEAELQRLGAMLAPVVFRWPGQPGFAPLQVAPWAGEPQAAALPGILRRLRGDWPCIPFGRTDRVGDLPPGWTPLQPEDTFGHGHAAHHPWEELDAGPGALALAIDLPRPGPLERLERIVRPVDGEPAVDLEWRIEARETTRLPVALHPTLRLDAGRVRLQLPAHGAALTYPVPAEPGRSRLAPDQRFARLDAAPLADGGTLDLTHYPLPFDTEELLMVTDLAGPVVVEYLDLGAALEIDWDRDALPDLMLWVSHRGRTGYPWNGRHLALGVEPVNGPFDLGRVAVPPADHPAARHGGLPLLPGRMRSIRSRLRAIPLG